MSSSIVAEAGAVGARGRSLLRSSIAIRIGLWCTLGAFVVVVAAVGTLYRSLVANLDEEDSRTLRETAANAQMFLGSSLELPGRNPAALDQRLGAVMRQELFLRILDDRGATLLETPGMADQLPPASFPALADVLDRGDTMREFRDGRGRLFETLAIVAEPSAGNGGRHFLQVGLDRANEMRLLEHYRARIWITLGMALLVCSLGSGGIVWVGLRPLQRIVDTARRIGSSTLHERIDAQGLPRELEPMASTFNEMIGRLEDGYERIAQFSTDVAHELRTPLNNLRGEIEIALGRARSLAEYQELLGSCLEECERLSRIIHSLLFLARAETGGVALHRDTIDLLDELRSVADFFEAAASEGGIALELRATSAVHLPVDRTLLQQAIGNLVANAIAYTPVGGEVSIELRADGDLATIEVSDTGIGIAPEHVPHVFDRFYRVDRARTGSSDHLGLGLAMVRSIAQLHGGSAVIRSRLGAGTCVRLLFPLRDASSPTRPT